MSFIEDLKKMIPSLAGATKTDISNVALPTNIKSEVPAAFKEMLANPPAKIREKVVILAEFPPNVKKEMERGAIRPGNFPGQAQWWKDNIGKDFDVTVIPFYADVKGSELTDVAKQLDGIKGEYTLAFMGHEGSTLGGYPISDMSKIKSGTDNLGIELGPLGSDNQLLQTNAINPFSADTPQYAGSFGDNIGRLSNKDSANNPRLRPGILPGRKEDDSLWENYQGQHQYPWGRMTPKMIDLEEYKEWLSNPDITALPPPSVERAFWIAKNQGYDVTKYNWRAGDRVNSGGDDYTGVGLEMLTGERSPQLQLIRRLGIDAPGFKEKWLEISKDPNSKISKFHETLKGRVTTELNRFEEGMNQPTIADFVLGRDRSQIKNIIIGGCKVGPSRAEDVQDLATSTGKKVFCQSGESWGTDALKSIGDAPQDKFFVSGKNSGGMVFNPSTNPIMSEERHNLKNPLTRWSHKPFSVQMGNFSTTNFAEHVKKSKEFSFPFISQAFKDYRTSPLMTSGFDSIKTPKNVVTQGLNLPDAQGVNKTMNDMLKNTEEIEF